MCKVYDIRTGELIAEIDIETQPTTKTEEVKRFKRLKEMLAKIFGDSEAA